MQVELRIQNTDLTNVLRSYAERRISGLSDKVLHVRQIRTSTPRLTERRAAWVGCLPLGWGEYRMK